MAADGQISLRSICPARHPEGGNPRLACAMAGFFVKSNNNGAMELTRLPYKVWRSCQRNRAFAQAKDRRCHYCCWIWNQLEIEHSEVYLTGVLM